MDTETQYQTDSTPAKSRLKPVLLAILVIVLIFAAAGGAYLWRDKQAGKQLSEKEQEVSKLQQKVVELEKDVSELEAQQETKEETDKETPTAEALDNIKAAVSSKNYAALDGYMATKINVILAASEGIGERTPAQAVSDLKYLDSAEAPWDFALASATIEDWKSGDYSSYFPENALVGKSADDMVVVFGFDSAGKINKIFLAASADIL